MSSISLTVLARNIDSSTADALASAAGHAYRENIEGRISDIEVPPPPSLFDIKLSELCLRLLKDGCGPLKRFKPSLTKM